MPEDIEEIVEVENGNDNEEERETSKEDKYEFIVAELERFGKQITELQQSISRLEQSDRIVHEQIEQQPEPRTHWYFRRINQ